METIKELITQANYYLNKHNTGSLAQDNATDIKGKEMLQQAVKRLESGDYEFVKLMSEKDLEIESDIEINWRDE